jgi:hypothetical protein
MIELWRQNDENEQCIEIASKNVAARFKATDSNPEAMQAPWEQRNALKDACFGDNCR